MKTEEQPDFEIEERPQKHPPIAYASRSAGRAFDPPIGEQAIRSAIKVGELPAYARGNRFYILRSDLIEWLKKGQRQ